MTGGCRGAAWGHFHKLANEELWIALMRERKRWNFSDQEMESFQTKEEEEEKAVTAGGLSN